MLYISLFVTLVMLVIVNVIVRRAEYPVPKAAGVCLVTPLIPFCGMMFFPAAALSAVCAGVLLLVVLIPRHGKRLYLPLSVVATLVAYGVVLRPVVEQHRELANLRQQYAFESIEQRLPARPRPTERPQHVNPSGLTALEDQIETASGENTYRSRTRTLNYLHEEAVRTFVNSPGFGVGRLGPPDVARRSLDEGGHGSPPVQQPDYAAPFVHPPLDIHQELPKGDAPKLLDLHSFGVLDFVNPKGFGYVKDRGRVAGFQSHGMSKVPESQSAWQVARIELVGVVVHDTPVAYLSQNLPRMDELRAAQTRPLDAFETAGLESLRKGEDLYARGADAKARMLGAIRATKQCTTCHGCDRGELLGAFSYGLRR
jgi:hypothetical protein